MTCKGLCDDSKNYMSPEFAGRSAVLAEATGFFAQPTLLLAPVSNAGRVGCKGILCLMVMHVVHLLCSHFSPPCLQYPLLHMLCGLASLVTSLSFLCYTAHLGGVSPMK